MPQGTPTPQKVIDYWADRWATGKTGWHRAQINQNLEKHFEKLVSVGADGKPRENLTFLFPLCGKTLDMQWVMKQGHKVVGIEGVLAPVEEFFAETGIPVQKEWNKEVECWVFTSPESSVKIIVCDLFKVTPELVGGVDCVFDRGSYVAIEKEDRKKYIELMYSLYKPDARHLMVTHEYDWTKHNGPPRHVDREEIAEFYIEIGEKVGKTAQVEVLDFTVETEGVARFNLEEMTIVNQFITLDANKTQ